MRSYEVVNWQRFQHYKADRPKWIKAYVALQDKLEYRQLADVTKAHLHGLWLLAARIGPQIPDDQEYVQQMIGAHEPIDFKSLVSACFLKPCINVEEISGKCTTKKETEGEIEREKKNQDRDAAFAALDGVVTGGTETEEGDDGDIQVLHPGRGLDDDGGDDSGSAPVPVRRDGGRENPVQRLLAVWIERYEERVGSTPSAKVRGKQGAVAKRIVANEALPDIAAALRGIECGGGPLYGYNVTECPEPQMWDLMTLEKLFPLAVAAGRGSGLPEETSEERAERIQRGIERERAASRN